MLYMDYDDMMCSMEKGTVWGHSGEGYSMGDTVEKGTIWGYRYGMWILMCLWFPYTFVSCNNYITTIV